MTYKLEDSQLSNSLMKRFFAKKYLVILALFLITVYYLLHQINFRVFILTFSKINFYLLISLIFIVAMTYIFPTFRLYFLANKKFNPLIFYNTQMLGMGLNSMLPFKSGDALKLIYLKNKTMISVSEGLSMAFWERFFDLNFIIVIGAAISQLTHLHFVTLALFGLLAFIWLVVIVNKKMPIFIRHLINLIPFSKFRLFCDRAAHFLRHPQQSLKFYLLVPLFTILGWLALYLIFCLIIKTIIAHQLSFMQIFIVFIAASLGFSLPATPGSIGVYEAAIVISLGWFGVDKNHALAAAVLIHIIQSLPPIIYSLILLLCTNISALKTTPISHDAQQREEI